MSAPCQPATRYPPSPTPPEKHPLWNHDGCQFLRQPTADPFRPGNCRPAKEPKSPRAPLHPPLHPSTPTQCLRWLCWLLTEAWERKAERQRNRMRKKGRKRESVCIFNLIASSLHFAPRLKWPLIPLYFFNMIRISPACGRHELPSRQPCVLTVDFESELR